jgi:hypothetical protein
MTEGLSARPCAPPSLKAPTALEAKNDLPRDNQAELAAQHLVNGQQVAFSGRLDPQWTGREGVERVSLEVHGVELEYGAKPRTSASAQGAAAAV